MGHVPRAWMPARLVRNLPARCAQNGAMAKRKQQLQVAEVEPNGRMQLGEMSSAEAMNVDLVAALLTVATQLSRDERELVQVAEMWETYRFHVRAIQNNGGRFPHPLAAYLKRDVDGGMSTR